MIRRYPNMSSAVRPMALAPDERYLYFQVSFFHGFVEYDLQQDKVLRLAHLPTTEQTPPTREQYLLDSAHHGLAMNPQGAKPCAAGAMDGHAAIVDRSTFAISYADEREVARIKVGDHPQRMRMGRFPRNAG